LNYGRLSNREVLSFNLIYSILYVKKIKRNILLFGPLPLTNQKFFMISVNPNLREQNVMLRRTTDPADLSALGGLTERLACLRHVVKKGHFRMGTSAQLASR
jgi:hypothetical protein